jgi:hypothetical protein
VWWRCALTSLRKTTQRTALQQTPLLCFQGLTNSSWCVHTRSIPEGACAEGSYRPRAAQNCMQLCIQHLHSLVTCSDCTSYSRVCRSAGLSAAL